MHFSLYKENELFRTVIVPMCIGLGLKLDGTKMKLSKKTVRCKHQKLLSEVYVLFHGPGKNDLLRRSSRNPSLDLITSVTDRDL